jgi:methionyl-tRNA formyltransferase
VTSEELFDLLAKLGVDPVMKTLGQIEKGEKPTPQDDAGATRAHKLSKEEAKINWNLNAEVIIRKIRAFNPEPSAWSYFRGQVLKLNNARLTNEIIPAGSLQVIGKSVLAGTATSALELLEVTPAGKSQMLASAWANGARINATDMLQ